MKKRIVVAMSGGVDSSVCAALLKKQGFEVIGVFMKLWSLDENKCCNIESLEAARKVASILDIPFYVVDLKKEFKEFVVDDYVTEYSRCHTPNPCVICNKIIKFDYLLKKTLDLGASHLATGHYVRLKSINSTHHLFTGIDETKDQSYFLWSLTQSQLKHLLFPIGEYRKPEVREIAKRFDLPTAQRAESQGLCFVGNLTQDQFLKEFIKFKSGPILDLKGAMVGEHRGLPLYTIGQRKGIIGLNLKRSYLWKKGKTPPLYVVKLDNTNNSLIIGEEQDLYQKELLVEKINWILGVQPQTKRIGARVRYGHPITMAQIHSQGRRLKVKFTQPIRAITPGQSIVFYLNDELLGGGIII
ncbi:MAG: tRNA 2-thiouridine(34) synthase MnmA [Candidatus Berkelbacteria bacterium]|nr:tRNA 2-thiouridine(34) synthase MnmA [Candidatus Berkelbacteria bacterium]